MSDEDVAFEAFGANLIHAGILPVEIRIKNDSENALDLRRAGWDLASSSNLRFERQTAMAAMNRLYKYYGVRTYSKRRRKELGQKFRDLGIDVSAPLSPSEQRRGLVFFAIPNSPDVHESILHLRLAVTNVGFLNRPERDLHFEFSLKASESR